MNRREVLISPRKTQTNQPLVKLNNDWKQKVNMQFRVYNVEKKRDSNIYLDLNKYKIFIVYYIQITFIFFQRETVIKSFEWLHVSVCVAPCICVLCMQFCLCQSVCVCLCLCLCLCLMVLCVLVPLCLLVYLWLSDSGCICVCLSVGVYTCDRLSLSVYLRMNSTRGSFLMISSHKSLKKMISCLCSIFFSSFCILV